MKDEDYDQFALYSEYDVSVKFIENISNCKISNINSSLKITINKQNLSEIWDRGFIG